ncbi:MAG: hypothetical protein J6T35_06105 [Bacteroidales bacterium]|nr:hypothetical protein [Bacteroidales bacterium]
MKKIITVFMAFFLFSFYANAQESTNYFLPEDETGQVLIRGIVEVPFCADTIKALAKDFEEEVAHWDRFDTGDTYFGLSKISFRTEIGVGDRPIELNFNITIPRPKSIVRFLLSIEVRDRKYRYTLSDFETERWRIRGDGPDSGPSNEMHRKRIACINNYPTNYRGKTRDEYLFEENESLRAEYDAVMAFVKEVENMCNRFDDF